LVYGTEGVGKSSLAATTPKPIFIQTEDGLGEIDCDKFPLAKSLEDVVAALTELETQQHDYQTVAIDSLDWLERLIWDAVCRRESATTIEKVGGGYGKGYTLALDYWRRLIDKLGVLHRDRGMMVFLIAHAKVEKFEDPEAPAYDRYSPRLHKHASAIITEWCDAVLFATKRFTTRTEESGFAAECECLWHVNHVDGEPVLTLARLDRPTCHLRRDYEGIWRGSWLEYERMPIEVIPEVEWKPTVDAIDPTQSRLLITVATGDSFRELLRYTGPLMEAYAKRIGADFVAITKPSQDWWGLEKFRVQPFDQSYERTLYVDADVFLTEETPDLFDIVPAGHVSMHDDWSQLPSFEWVFDERRNILESQEIPMDYSKVVLNSGIVMCDRKHAAIWRPPLHPFFPTHCSEQF
jgi:hypothetical protein